MSTENNIESRIVNLTEGTVIMKEGELYPFMYKIIKGNGEVYVGYGTEQQTLIGIIGKQSCFGEYGLLLGKPSIYTVVAYSDICLLRIGSDELEDFIKTNHKNVIDIMRNMAGTMMTMRKQIELMINEITSGNKPSKDMINKISRTARGYGMYMMINGAAQSNDNALDKKI